MVEVHIKNIYLALYYHLYRYEVDISHDMRKRYLTMNKRHVTLHVRKSLKVHNVSLLNSQLSIFDTLCQNPLLYKYTVIHY